MLLLLLPCLPGCCRGVDWRGLGCMYEINYFESRTTRSRYNLFGIFIRHSRRLESGPFPKGHDLLEVENQ